MSVRAEKQGVITFAPIPLEAFIVDVDQDMRSWDQLCVRVCMQTCLWVSLNSYIK